MKELRRYIDRAGALGLTALKLDFLGLDVRFQLLVKFVEFAQALFV